MAMGLTVITRRSLVGASELLEGLPEVYFCDREGFSVPKIPVLDVDTRFRIQEQRLKQLGDVSWTNAGAQLSTFLSSRD
jgi:hypothetical protein